MADIGKERRSAEGPTSEMEVGEIREMRETEFKILGDFERRLASILEKEGAEKVFEGVLTIQWFKNGLPRGVSARVKEVRVGKKTKYIWTIKLDGSLVQGAGAKRVRDVHEREGREKTFAKAKAKLFSEIDTLVEEMDLLDMPIPETRHTRTLQIGKERTSYVFKDGQFKGLRLDFDTITEANGKRIGPIHLVEIEDTSDDELSIKERRILACASALGFLKSELQPEFSGLSTEALLLRLGFLERAAEVSDKRPVYPVRPKK